MSMIREMGVRRLVGKQIVGAIKDDLDQQGEALMKECWEELESDEDYKVANDEMREIIKLIEARYKK